jgi:hypothetical protein
MDFSLGIALGVVSFALGFYLGKRDTSPVLIPPKENIKRVESFQASVTRRDDMTLWYEEKKDKKN